MENKFKHTESRTIYATPKDHVKCFLVVTVRSTDRMATVWDVLKVFIHGKFICYIIQYRAVSHLF